MINFQPMVHCVSSSEPDSGDGTMMTDEWRIQGSATKEIRLNQGHQRKTYVESTVTTGIQVGSHVEQGNQLTLIDIHHQPADTTHPENTYVDSQEHMDTSSPNHSTYSDTMDHSQEELNTSKEIGDDVTIDDNSFIADNSGENHYQPIIYNHQFVPDLYRQQTFLSDNEYLTGPSSHTEHILGIDDVTCEQIDQIQLNSDENHENIHKSQNYDYYSNENQKVVSVEIATPELYPHLYNYRSDSNEIAVVDYPADNFNSYVYNNVAYVDQQDDYEDSESSED